LVKTFGFPNLWRDRGLLALTGKHTSTGRLLALSLGAGALLGGITLAWGASQARAGQYTVWSCRGPGGQPISAQAWNVNITDAAAADMRTADECAGGGPLLIEATPQEPISTHSPTGEAVFQPPAGTVIPSFKVWRYAFANDGPATPAGEDDYGASLREWPAGFNEGIVSECAQGFREPLCSFGTPAEPLGASNYVDEHTWTVELTPGEGVLPLERLGFWVSCIRSGCEPAAEGTTAVFELFRAAVTVEDDQAPVVERLEGSLTEPAALSGTAGLLVTATDRGGGVAGFEFAIDGGAPQRLKAAGGECEEPFSAPQPCPTTATRGISVDTAGLAPGAHSVSGVVTDAAGNATPFGPVAFTVAAPAKGGPMLVGDQPNNGTPAVNRPRLRLSSPKGGRGKRRAAQLRGSLTTPAGVPIAGARLSVEISELGSKGAGRTLAVHTDSHGRFALKVAGEGAHNVVVSYSPILGGPVSRTAAALVKAPISLRLSTAPRPPGERRTVHFHGRLRGAGKAARGATAEIQAIANGRWTTVETVTVGARGTFAWTHRFRYVERDALFSFRAVIPKTPGWPWPTARSPRIKVPIAAAAR
jgi:hypothetical protein